MVVNEKISKSNCLGKCEGVMLIQVILSIAQQTSIQATVKMPTSNAQIAVIPSSVVVWCGLFVGVVIV